MQVNKKWVLVGLLISLTLLPASLWAATYYVSPSGDDSNPGTAAQPWQTIQKAANTVQAGATVIIQDGVYTGGITIETPATATQPIVFRAEGKGAVINGSGTRRDAFFIDGYALNPDYCKGGDMYIEVVGLTIQNATRAGLRISCAHHVSVKNCTMKDNGTWGIFTDFSNYTLLQDNECSGSKAEHGIYVSNSSDYPTIRGNRSHHNAACGFQINADPSTLPEGDGITTGALVEQNVIYENGNLGGAGINLASVRNSVIRNNLIYNNYAGGIAGWANGEGPAWGCKNNLISNNTIYFRSGEGRWAISLKEGSTGCLVLNNILSGGARGAFEFDNDTIIDSLAMDYNLLYSADRNQVAARENPETYFILADWQTVSGGDSHSFSAAPNKVFVNHFTEDFHLRPGSPCIHAGDPSPAYNNRDGSRNDLGAYGGPYALGEAPVKASALPGLMLLLD